MIKKPQKTHYNKWIKVSFGKGLERTVTGMSDTANFSTCPSEQCLEKIRLSVRKCTCTQTSLNVLSDVLKYSKDKAL